MDLGIKRTLPFPDPNVNTCLKYNTYDRGVDIGNWWVYDGRTHGSLTKGDSDEHGMFAVRARRGSGEGEAQ